MTKKRVGTFGERFVRELQRQSGNENGAVTNRALREALGWEDERFRNVREGLLRDGIVVASTGQGGKTRLSDPPKTANTAKKSLKVFVSYSHADEKLKDALLAHLKPLERLGLIQSWSDRMIKPGEIIDASIKEQLESSDLILLLVSVDFINSRYCYEIELQNALERHSKKKVHIVPIILRSCLWTHSPFGGLLALPKDGKAVASAAWSNIDEALAHVAEELLKLATDLLNPV
jgi:hypothetical protein